MLETLQQAKAKLEQEGLHVSCNDANSLWIAANLRDVGQGIILSNDTCSLFANGGHGVAVFPADGMQTCELPRTPPELIAAIVTVYAYYRRMGGMFKDVVKKVMGETNGHLARLRSELAAPSP